ncbi:MAG: PAS domain-containing protein [Fimbriimonas sp.]
MNQSPKDSSALLWENPDARQVLDTMSEWFVALDELDVIVFINRALAEASRQGYEGFIGRYHWDLWPEMRGTIVEDSYRRARATGVPVRFEYHHSRSNVWIDVNAYPSGRHLHVYFRDITEHKRVEAEQRERTDLLKSMVDGFPQIAWVADLDGNPTYLNQRWWDYSGLDPTQPYRASRVLHPADFGRMEHFGAEGFSRGEPFEQEGRLRRADGEYRWHLVRVVPRTAANGTRIGFFGTATDVHDLKVAERTLKATMDAVPVLLTYIDADLRYRVCNRAYEDWFGRPRASIIGRTVREVAGEDTYERVRPFMESALAGRAVEYEQWLTRASGSRRFMRGKYVPHYAEDGQVDGLYAIVLDDTDSRVAQEALRFLIDMEEATRGLEDPAETMRVVAQLLGEHLGADRCAYGEVEEDEDHFVIQDDYIVGEMPTMVGRYSMADFGERNLNLQRAGRTFVVNDVAKEIADAAQRETYAQSGIQAVVSVPLLKRGRLAAGMAVHQRTPRVWTAAEIRLVEMVVDRCWATIERIRATRALRAGEERYRFLAESTPGIVFTTGPDGDVDYVNGRWQEYFGFSFERGRTNAWRDVVHPDDFDRALAILRRNIESGEPIQVEYQLRRRDGHYRWHICRMEAMRDPEGRIVRWFGTILDIHQQRTRERTLEITNRIGALLAEDLDLERIVQALTDASTEVVGAAFGAFFYHVPHADGEIMTLYTLSGAPKEAFDGFGMPRPTHVFGPTFRGEGPVRSDDITKDPRYGRVGPHFGMPVGHLPVASYLAIPVVSRAGEVLGGLFFGHPEPGLFTEEHERLVASFAAQAAVAIDNARLYARVNALNEGLEQRVKERTAELSEANRSLHEAYVEAERFSYAASHDLRAPLRAVIATSRMILEDFGPVLPEDAVHLLNRQTASARRLASLIEDLLEYSRIGRQEVARSPLDLSQIATEVATELGGRNRRTKIEIEPDLTSNGDPLLVRLVIQNLIENALVYSPEGGTIRVGRDETREGCPFFVRDEGIGMDMAYADKIFEPFQRLHLDTEYSGTGIGLANVRRIIERHSGQIWVESEPEKGATFFFTLG